MPTLDSSTGSPASTQDGADEILEWSGSGSFNFSVGGTITYLIVSGGASGGHAAFAGAGGGGAGAMRSSTFTAVAGQSYTVAVGVGGVTQSTTSTDGNSGGSSGITVGTNAPGTLVGGGGGAGTGAGVNSSDGSGGGAAGDASSSGGTSGTYGNDGGDGGADWSGGGGGGASAVGANAVSATVAGAGGAGSSDSITGSAIDYAGGGGGGIANWETGTLGVGGAGGGGSGGDSGTTPTAGADGLGGGGGGNSNDVDSGAGGDGTVIIRWTPESSTPLFTRPDADDSIGNWTRNTGSAVDLFQAVDEVVRDDADYVQSAFNPSADIVKFRLSNFTSATTDPHVVRYPYGKSHAGQNIDITVRLVQGASTTIATWVHSNVSTTLTLAEQTLTAPQVAAITDYDDLFVELEADAP